VKVSVINGNEFSTENGEKGRKFLSMEGKRVAWGKPSKSTILPSVGNSPWGCFSPNRPKTTIIKVICIVFFNTANLETCLITTPPSYS